jgi:uncharacterized protein YjcR
VIKSKTMRGVPHPERRKVERPPYEQVMSDVHAMGFLAVGRKYGVSDNAIRKWIRWYEYERHRKADEIDGRSEGAAA